ncbi:MAG TPA: hypothetical protein VFU23_03295 [Gemmatimonadales bacterium]|nr:hypothetical protein [Gemmatimonadales bacterium]
MSRRDHLWQIIVRCNNHAQLPRERIIGRDTQAAAIDAATRELRRTRNTARDGLDYDRWDLYDFDRGRRYRKLIATGGIYGQDTPVPGSGSSRSVGAD